MFSELRAANVERCNTSFKHSLEEWTETDWACATAGEMGELCNLIKKRRRGENITRVQCAWEMADVVIYLDLLAARMGIDLEQAVRNKFNIVSERVGSPVRL